MKLKNVLKVMPTACVIDIKVKMRIQKEPISVYMGKLETLPYNVLREHSESQVSFIGYGNISILVDSEERSERKQGIILIVNEGDNHEL